MKKCAKILAVCLLFITLLSLAGCACMGTLSGCFTKCGSCLLNGLGKCNSHGIVFCSHCDLLTCLMDDCLDGACTETWDDCFETSCYQTADKCPADCYPEGNPSDYVLLYSDAGETTVSPYFINLSYYFSQEVVGTSGTHTRIVMHMTVSTPETMTDQFEDVRVVCGIKEASNEFTYSTRYIPSLKGDKSYSVDQVFYISQSSGSFDYSDFTVTMQMYGVKK